jgi:hypothetical protein
MPLYKVLWLAISTILVLVCDFSLAVEDAAVVKPVTQLGMHPSPDAGFNVVLRQNNMGGATDLFVMKRHEPIFYAADVTGYLWVNKVLIYSSLPLYGSAGIYMYDPVMEMRASIVDGKENEYFELKSFSKKTKKLGYFYSNDIENFDVAKLKASKEAVREIPLPNGT